jgi:hypothetical protein
VSPPTLGFLIAKFEVMMAKVKKNVKGTTRSSDSPFQDY